MVASAIFFLDSKGHPLLSRNYRGDIPMSTIDNFPPLLLESDVPCISRQGVNYMYISHNNIYVLALSKKNADAGVILQFLHSIISVLKEYLVDVQEESIRDNFVVIYELLDEMIDFGHPQVSDPKVLQEYITQESHQLDLESASSIVSQSVPWRPNGIFYKKNELFLDVQESLNSVINSDGTVIRSEIIGKVNVTTYLSGMPNLKLGLNDAITRHNTPQNPEAPTRVSRAAKYVNMTDVKFHQCVDLDQFEKDRAILFVPPDGKFELMSYRVADVKSRPLFLVDCKIDTKSHSRVIVEAKLKSQYRKRSVASSVEVVIPVPQDADSPRFRTRIGTVVYAPEKNAVVWHIKNFAGGHEASMSAELQLPSIRDEDDPSNAVGGPRSAASQLVQVKFDIPYLAVSGLQVRYLKVTEPNLKYQSLPWVRYLTQSGDEYSIRL